MTKRKEGRRKSRFIPDEKKRKTLADMLEQAAGIKQMLEALGGQVAEIIGGSSQNAPTSMYLREIGLPSDPNSVTWRATQQIEAMEEKLHAALGALRSSKS